MAHFGSWLAVPQVPQISEFAIGHGIKLLRLSLKIDGQENQLPLVTWQTPFNLKWHCVQRPANGCSGGHHTILRVPLSLLNETIARLPYSARPPLHSFASCLSVAIELLQLIELAPYTASYQLQYFYHDTL